MLAKRIIPCLDVKDGKVVKGVKFRNHEIVGDIVELAKHYSDAGADELVFYDITASSDNRVVDTTWISRIAEAINIPFCVAGGIRSVENARAVFGAGADKISINSPALENPALITDIATIFGVQAVVVGIDSHTLEGVHSVYQYTGAVEKSTKTTRETIAWVKEAQERGAGEIVLNCMNQDGVRQGYDCAQLQEVRTEITIPLIASGGAGAVEHFYDVFATNIADGALAASIFHKNIITIADVKTYLNEKGIPIRL